mmetsp:Transcript_141/g.24  ORF Transcript_141/g.24 Transcript_141/m.24 type:complete len:120 (+) Transcript_141:221-580(+)
MTLYNIKKTLKIYKYRLFRIEGLNKWIMKNNYMIIENRVFKTITLWWVTLIMNLPLLILLENTLFLLTIKPLNKVWYFLLLKPYMILDMEIKTSCMYPLMDNYDLIFDENLCYVNENFM